MCRDSYGSRIENIFCAKADYFGESYVFFKRLDYIRCNAYFINELSTKSGAFFGSQ